MKSLKRWAVSEYIHKVERGFCRTHIVVGFVVGELCTAMGTGIHVVAGINPAEAYLSLKVPVAVNDPGISVGYAKSTVPSREGGVWGQVVVMISRNTRQEGSNGYGLLLL